MITLSHVSYTYDPGTPMETAGLRDVSLEVREGEFLGLIGHTGSGKSTVIQHMNGLLQPDAGRVLWNGEDIFAKKYNRRALRGKVGLVFQYPEHQLFETDVLADVCYGPRNQGLNREEAEKRAREALETVRVPESYFSRSPFELSGGEKRRVAIAGVLAMQPSIMILDEPTAGLDPRGREELLQTLAALKDGGMGIVLVSHSMEDVARFADRIVVMHDAQILLQGTPREVFSHEEELEAVGLAVPKVNSLVRHLAGRGFPVETGALTVQEAAEAICAAFHEKENLTLYYK